MGLPVSLHDPAPERVSETPHFAGSTWARSLTFGKLGSDMGSARLHTCAQPPVRSYVQAGAFPLLYTRV